MSGLIVKSAARKQLGKMRASKDFFTALDKHIAETIKTAVVRTKGNGRKTCRGYDV